MLFPEHCKPFEHKQFDEQNPDKRPEFAGHLKYLNNKKLKKLILNIFFDKPACCVLTN